MKSLIVKFLFLFVCFVPIVSAKETYVRTSDGLEIAYELKMAKSSPSRGTVLLVHGLGANLDEWHFFAKALRKAGWNTLALDLRGHGMSNYMGNEEYRWSEMSETLLKASSQDLKAVLEKVPEGGDFWVVGASFGANLAFNLAAENESVKGAVLFSPSLHYAGVLTWEAAKKMRRLPVMFLASTEDTHATEGATELFNKVPGPKVLKIYPGLSHGSVLLQDIKNLDKEIIAWMQSPNDQAK